MTKPRIFSREDRLRLRLRRSADPKPEATSFGRGPTASGMAIRGHTVRGTMLRPSPRWHQRVTVKIKYKERYGTGPKADKAYARTLARQVAYNTRTDAKARAEGVEPVAAFDRRRERIDGYAAVRAWGGDRRYWKLIISPERGHDMKNFLGYVREVMAAVETDVLTDDEIKRGERLGWVGVIHDDTDHRHAHVILRGSLGDRDLTLSKAYLSHGIRARAAEIATRHLGYRMGRDSPLASGPTEPEQALRQIGRTPGWGIG
ncbi:type IV secretory pathway VirD2 relaxase [Skermanella aerolata]|uniref:hypothetical protein n=1 Tax=Skermanella aerolata TaxID=393310 RepID=UPI003D192A9E